MRRAPAIGDTHPQGRARRARFMSGAGARSAIAQIFRPLTLRLSIWSSLTKPVRRILNIIREHRARKRLAEIVANTRDSYAIQDYRKRRAAALKGMGR